MLLPVKALRLTTLLLETDPPRTLDRGFASPLPLLPHFNLVPTTISLPPILRSLRRTQSHPPVPIPNLHPLNSPAKTLTPTTTTKLQTARPARNSSVDRRHAITTRPCLSTATKDRRSDQASSPAATNLSNLNRYESQNLLREVEARRDTSSGSITIFNRGSEVGGGFRDLRRKREEETEWERWREWVVRKEGKGRRRRGSTPEIAGDGGGVAAAAAAMSRRGRRGDVIGQWPGTGQADSEKGQEVNRVCGSNGFRK